MCGRGRSGKLIVMSEEREVLVRLRHELGRVRPSPRIFWADFLASVGIGWLMIAVASHPTTPRWGAVIAIVVGAFGLWRAAYFVHEISHFAHGEMPGFEVAFNLLVGMPCGLPSFMVDSHADHHRTKRYGTELDPEWEPVAEFSRLKMFGSIVVSALLPPLLWLRWALLAPLGWMIRPLRRLLWQRASSLVINAKYLRAIATGAQRRRILVGEIGATVFAWATGASVALGWLPLRAVVCLGLALSLALGLNQARTLVAHRYVNATGPMDRDAQISDSVTIAGGWLGEAMLPVGTRYHALHHLVPSLPYHALPAAHRELMAKLPPDAAYRATVFPTLGHALWWRWRTATERRARPATV
jgi:fatty acid desaturase